MQLFNLYNTQVPYKYHRIPYTVPEITRNVIQFNATMVMLNTDSALTVIQSGAVT